jgi:hypothetical protein
MTALTNHEIAILREIFHYEAINGSFIQKSEIVRNLQNKGFDPVNTTIKILELEKTKLLIETPQNNDYSGYFLTNAGETYVINNVILFEVKEQEAPKEQEVPF